MTLLTNLLTDPWIWKWLTYLLLITNVVTFIGFIVVSNACNNLVEIVKGQQEYIKNDDSALVAKTAIENSQEMRQVNKDLVELNRKLFKELNNDSGR